jgi:coenzyme F420 hydrogenase subunit beta
VDATGELADFSCGDAWLDRFIEADENPWSIIIARSEPAKEILLRMTRQGRLAVADITTQEVIYSQRFNLQSKLSRQRKRMTLCRMLGIAMPRWDVDLPRDGGNYLYEIRTLVNKARTAARYRLRSWLRSNRP